jgi:hypothetical protein
MYEELHSGTTFRGRLRPNFILCTKVQLGLVFPMTLVYFRSRRKLKSPSKRSITSRIVCGITASRMEAGVHARDTKRCGEFQKIEKTAPRKKEMSFEGLWRSIWAKWPAFFSGWIVVKLNVAEKWKEEGQIDFVKWLIIGFGGNCGKAVALGEGTEKVKDSQSRVLSDLKLQKSYAG